MGDPLPRNDDPASLLGRSFLGLEIFEYRNSEHVHRDALAAAQAEHIRVREVAQRAYELHEARIAQQELHQRSLQEEERVRIETARAEAEVRLREIENAAKRIPVPPPRLPTPPPPPAVPQETPKPAAIPAIPTPAPASSTASQQNGQTNQPIATPQPISQLPQIAQAQTQTRPPTTQAQNPFQQSQPLQASQPFQQNQQSPQPAANAFLQQQQLAQKPVQQSAAPKVAVKQATNHLLWNPERYREIHQELKKLRQFVLEDSKNKPLPIKNKTGDLRRKIRTSCGQLTQDPKLNTQPRANIISALREALKEIPSTAVDPSTYMVSKPEPTQGALHNGDTMPALFLYLLNMLAKGLIAQLISEAGPTPAAAEGIGHLTVSIFSQAEFLWRGQSMIDIFMAKMRVVCPALFGFRGRDTTEQGRIQLGWKKEGGAWVSDQTHSERMTGLGAGYASICLRDFSRSPNPSPWKPWHYWQTLATITSTPPDEASATQFMVLKAMIELSEQKFLRFYGNAGLAALRVALVEFPERATQKGAANMSLAVVADKLLKDLGLRLR